MGKLTKGFLLGVASALGAYYYKNPEQAKKHKDLVVENVKTLLDKINTLDENEENLVEVEEVEENGIYLQSDASEELKEVDAVKVEEKEKLDSLLSAFDPQEEKSSEKVSETEDKTSSKAGLVAGAAALGGAAVATPFIASALTEDEAEAEESIIEDEPSALEELVKESAIREEKSSVEETPVVEEEFVAAEEDFASAEEEFLAAEEDFTSVEEEFLAAEEDFTSVEEEFLAAEEDFTSVEEEFLAAEEDFASVEEEFVAAEEDFASVEEEFVAAEEDFASVEEEFVTEDSAELTEEEQLAKLDREIAELEAQIRAEGLDPEESEALHTFDLSEANLDEYQEETTEEVLPYERDFEGELLEEELTYEDELEEEPAKKSFFGKIKSLVGLGKKEEEAELEDASVDFNNISIEKLKEDIGENSGVIPVPLEELQGQATDKLSSVKDEALKRADIHGLEEKLPESSNLENIVSKVKGDIEEKGSALTEEVEETKETKGALGSIVSLFTSKK